MKSASAKCVNQCRCVFNKQARGDLAVPQRVDMRPLLLKRTPRRLDEASLVTHYHDGVALPDELARLELLELKRFVEQGPSAIPSRPRKVPAKGITEGPCMVHSTSSVRSSSTAGISPRPNAS